MHLRLQRESTYFIEMKRWRRWRETMRACLRFWKSLRRIRESFGSFRRADFGEIRNGVLATHFPCTTLLPPTNSIFLFCTGLRVTRRDGLAIELQFFKTIDACIGVKIKAPMTVSINQSWTSLLAFCLRWPGCSWERGAWVGKVSLKKSKNILAALSNFEKPHSLSGSSFLYACTRRPLKCLRFWASGHWAYQLPPMWHKSILVNVEFVQNCVHEKLIDKVCLPASLGNGWSSVSSADLINATDLMCPSSFATAPDQLWTLPRWSLTRLQGCMPAKGNQEHFSVFLFLEWKIPSPRARLFQCWGFSLCVK